MYQVEKPKIFNFYLIVVDVLSKQLNLTQRRKSAKILMLRVVFIFQNYILIDFIK